ncbi:hypothetical protein SAMN04515620_10532 [Collimonas sp. OK607]|uniref:hypothetical protein n=1 Tax=Collimonas sp. OK607 TaxID=1798194 RepID=UPI0008E19052|nr:hypothetical protein [Collimonas sp. OK607]SFA84846.1 hypothetical protein SAMN04515620_10532 [Collimonas sp. OK607]
MMSVKAAISKIKPGFYGYQVFTGDEKIAEDYDYSRIADVIKAIAGDVDESHAVELSYSHFVVGTYTGLELDFRSEEIAEMVVERMGRLHGD